MSKSQNDFFALFDIPANSKPNFLMSHLDDSRFTDFQSNRKSKITSYHIVFSQCKNNQIEPNKKIHLYFNTVANFKIMTAIDGIYLTEIEINLIQYDLAIRVEQDCNIENCYLNSSQVQDSFNNETLLCAKDFVGSLISKNQTIKDQLTLELLNNVSREFSVATEFFFRKETEITSFDPKVFETYINEVSNVLEEHYVDELEYSIQFIRELYDFVQQIIKQRNLMQISMAHFTRLLNYENFVKLIWLVDQYNLGINTSHIKSYMNMRIQWLAISNTLFYLTE